MLSPKQSVLYLHIPKTGGTYVETHVRRAIRRPGVPRRRPPGAVWSDYSRDELTAAARRRGVFLTTHFFTPNNCPEENPVKPHTRAASPAESEALFRVFKAAGWFVFSWVRDPREMLCSLYRYGKENAGLKFAHHRPGETLDDFCRRHPVADIPAYWPDLDFVAELTDGNLTRFFKTHLGRSYRPGPRLNGSGNLGYAHYCAAGEISRDTQEMLAASHNYKVFCQIRSLTRIFL